jgi:hypothetical protein
MKPQAGQQQDQSSSARRAQRERSRPFLKRWIDAVDAKVASKRLGEFCLRLGEKLTNYPSANVGKSYPGQERLGRDLGKAPRTVRAALKDMRDEGLLIRKRGGPGQTATQWFAIDGKALFETTPENASERGEVVDFPVRSRRKDKPQDRPKMATLDRPKMATLDRPKWPLSLLNRILLNKIILLNSPQPPQATTPKPRRSSDVVSVFYRAVRPQGVWRRRKSRPSSTERSLAQFLSQTSGTAAAETATTRTSPDQLARPSRRYRRKSARRSPTCWIAMVRSTLAASGPAYG